MNQHDILKEISLKYGVTVDQMLGRRRGRKLIKARLEFIQQTRDMGWSLNKIAKELGNRDHTTILYHLQTMDKQKSGMWKDA